MNLVFCHCFFFILFLLLLLFYSSKTDYNIQIYSFSLLFFFNIFQSLCLDYIYNYDSFDSHKNLFFYLNLLLFSLNLVFEYIYPHFFLYFVSQAILNIMNITFIKTHYENDLRELTPLI
jgi:hypothetical protein